MMIRMIRKENDDIPDISYIPYMETIPKSHLVNFFNRDATC